MKKIIVAFFLFSTFLFANNATTVSKDLILNPSPEQIAKAIPLNNTICPVFDSKIGSMGKAEQVVYKGKVVNLCCNGCPPLFAKEPEKFLKKAEESTPKNKS
ncbi:MAG: hypothetical protein GX116_00770 [Fibrobacter sp.]|jgi:YHS domain-containing protein|nr:hypothetical protein [Fibrobacter sp.]